jgi:FkbM family methyltransferase
VDIYAVEPYGPNYKRLQTNLALNNCSKVITLQVAVGESVGSVEFTVPENNSITDVASVNGSFSKAISPSVKWKTETVKLETVDHIKSGNNIAQIDLLKCDVETYEMSVFRGMDHILDHDRPAILLECFLEPERELFFNNILKRYRYFAYAVLEEGIVYLNNGFQRNEKGLNYLLSPVVPTSNFISHKMLADHPELILSNPKR